MNHTIQKLILFSLFYLHACTLLLAQPAEKPNFIFIVVDDLNDYVEGFTDQAQVVTPHIKALADSGVVFLNAFTNSPGCAPSRTSFLSGKDLAYTQVYTNEDYDNIFRDNFTAAKHNEEVFTLPEILKDSGGYFTYAINKIFHNDDKNDFDNSAGTLPCEKSQSWNRMEHIVESDSIESLFESFAYDDFFDWGMIPDSLEPLMKDVIAIDSAVTFLNNAANGTASICGNPFFLALGINKPHGYRYIPEKYFPSYFLKDVNADPYLIPYNHPVNNFPPNGIIMPPQPDIQYADYFALPAGGIGQLHADAGMDYEYSLAYYDSLTEIPVVDPDLSDTAREYVIEESMRANYLMNYMAAINFADAQIGKVLSAVNANPELKENTIIILMSDNAFSNGEKRHWTKWALWETDLRIPLIISGPEIPAGAIVKNTVSALDLFPTICELAQVNEPLFSNGTRYLDGYSLVPMLQNPELKITNPAISSHIRNMSEGSCFPSHSIRDQRFHYIVYRKNNDGSFETEFCQTESSEFEEELYEIGENREVDPYEWNNLITDPNYAPVVNYLQQFLPDSNLYLQKTFSVEISNNTISCYLEKNDTIYLHSSWYDQDGINSIPSPSFIFKWKNNITADILTGTDPVFVLTTMSDVQFTENNKLIFYLDVYDTTGNLIAFDMQYYYLNPETAPIGNFSVSLDSNRIATIYDLSIAGNYISYWWDLGDGPVFYNQIPGPYQISDTSRDMISLFVEFGNNNCISEFHEYFPLSVEIENSISQISVYPNPANQFVTLHTNNFENATGINIFNSTGQCMKRLSILPGEINSFLINVSTFNAGLYILVVTNKDSELVSTPFIIQHP